MVICVRGFPREYGGVVGGGERLLGAVRFAGEFGAGFFGVGDLGGDASGGVACGRAFRQAYGARRRRARRPSGRRRGRRGAAAAASDRDPPVVRGRENGHLHAQHRQVGRVRRNVEDDEGPVRQRSSRLLVVDRRAEMACQNRGVGEFWHQRAGAILLAFLAHRRM